MMRLSFRINFFCLGLVAWAILISGGVQAKDKTPHQYQKAILKEIKETREPKTVYRQVKQSDGTTMTLPQTEYENIYHIKVSLGDEIIVGRYTPVFSFKRPPDWTIGKEVDIRFQKNRMYLKKPNGKELKTKIEQRSQAQ